MTTFNFSDTIRSWYEIHKRDLPWRDTRDPYPIWLSEIILQQTRVNQGLPYFERFIEAFPTVQNLAAASQEEVLKLWQGLGYYSRARNLHTAAQQIADRRGIFPDNFKGLLDLKGVGSYTAAAIASFAYDEPVAVVDGNVYRVLSRYYGIDDPINETMGIKKFQKLANEVLDPKHAAQHNQAIMEFGALQCVPSSPDCKVCPLINTCKAYQTGQVDQLPVKIKKTKVLNLHHHYLVAITPSGRTILVQRPQTGIWAGLYEFPFIESNGAMLPQEITGHDVFKDVFGRLRFRESIYNQQPILHKLSHRKIHAYFWIIEVDEELDDAVTVNEMLKKPVHVLMERFIKAYWKLKK
ncbi:A/G-specific adenine glycosylase [Nonlabens ponticola]|uniref:Adenine DNA glycosylase n=1 Tax=Nonlabens ponticola TaxID=2496866 RepID=A0A3S9N178_9FLAO|nr:A/G-specific adenine glycosylase [Nonlabens ponticola]